MSVTRTRGKRKSNSYVTVGEATRIYLQSSTCNPLTRLNSPKFEVTTVNPRARPVPAISENFLAIDFMRVVESNPCRPDNDNFPSKVELQANAPNSARISSSTIAESARVWEISSRSRAR